MITSIPKFSVDVDMCVFFSAVYILMPWFVFAISLIGQLATLKVENKKKPIFYGILIGSFTIIGMALCFATNGSRYKEFQHWQQKVFAQDPLVDPQLDIKNRRFMEDLSVPWIDINETWKTVNMLTECSTSAIPRYPFRDHDKGARDMIWRSLWAGESAAVLPLGYPLFIGAAFGCMLRLFYELL